MIIGKWLGQNSFVAELFFTWPVNITASIMGERFEVKGLLTALILIASFLIGCAMYYKVGCWFEDDIINFYAGDEG
ncbi:hypothetical protein F3J29_05540 [Enterobacter sp. Cy-643]|uniref:hypothetical protein n=1 Tax=Enterobacter sp. Cy-643 TaxID=2608346 RepID=UPI001423DFEF|nr:hypothetical protein [Enterobacter sp. Cy-643]NIF31597.1 hypothetical protein [Enterobacter sp. Cy-643]